MKPLRVNGKIVGGVIRNKYGVLEYHSKRNPKIHLMRKFNGYGISLKILELLQKEKVVIIVLETPECNFVSSVDKFLGSEKTYTDVEDKQYFLNVTDMLPILSNGQKSLL
tara:strand:+ start:212 stop:541 length:330 start_codon:yes stop_codon:yes gene_type:complete